MNNRYIIFFKLTLILLSLIFPNTNSTLLLLLDQQDDDDEKITTTRQSTNDNNSNNVNVNTKVMNDPTSISSVLWMATILCHGKCNDDDCVTYQTPMNQCYNGQILFPNDPSWGIYDIYDQWNYYHPIRNNNKNINNNQKIKSRRKIEASFIVSNNNNNMTFQRMFHKSNDSSCNHQHDDITLPWYECVGPFGLPRPWGSFLPP